MICERRGDWYFILSNFSKEKTDVVWKTYLVKTNCIFANKKNINSLSTIIFDF